MIIKKIYDMLNVYDYPVMLDNEIKLGNISIYIDSKGRLILRNVDRNKSKQIVIEIEDINDMTIGAEIYASLLSYFDWEL